MSRRRSRTPLLILIIGIAWPLAAAGQLAPRSAADWIEVLEAPRRVASLKVEEVIAKLDLRPGEVVADLGAGSGVFSIPLAKAVGGTGKVYAVDIDRALIEHIDAKAKRLQIANVRPVLGQFADPALPAADVDVAFMHDVLHHVADRVAYLKNAVRYLKPRGRFAIVEPDAHTGPHSNDPKLQITQEQLAKWMADVGFVQSNEFKLFADKWYVVYIRK